jgi:hypothetical protein
MQCNNVVIWHLLWIVLVTLRASNLLLPYSGVNKIYEPNDNSGLVVLCPPRSGTPSMDWGINKTFQLNGRAQGRAGPRGKLYSDTIFRLTEIKSRENR